MNCNPLVHPDAYAAMLSSAFGSPTTSPADRDASLEVVAE
jgi:hypothetical protein